MSIIKWSVLSLISGSLFVFAGVFLRVLLKNPPFTGPLMGLGILLGSLGLLGLLLTIYKMRTDPKK